MPAPRVAFCVFCDDLRQEVGNKLSYMGVYTSDLLVFGRPPVTLPRFTIITWLISDIDDPPQQLIVRVVVGPDEQERVRIDLQPNPDAKLSHLDGAAKVHAQIAIPLVGFPLEQEGYIQVMLETERETIRAGRLMVSFNDDPAAALTLHPSIMLPPTTPPGEAPLS